MNHTRTSVSNMTLTEPEDTFPRVLASDAAFSKQVSFLPAGTVGGQSGWQSFFAGSWGVHRGVVYGAGPKTRNASHSAAQGHGLDFGG